MTITDNFSDLLADRTHLMQASAIREILKLVSRPGMISLAGGMTDLAADDAVRRAYLSM